MPRSTGSGEFYLIVKHSEVAFGGGGGDTKLLFEAFPAEFAVGFQFIEDPVLPVGRGVSGFFLVFRCAWCD